MFIGREEQLKLLDALVGEMIPKIADATFLLDGGYKKLTRDEVISILRQSL